MVQGHDNFAFDDREDEHRIEIPSIDDSNITPSRTLEEPQTRRSILPLNIAFLSCIPAFFGVISCCFALVRVDWEVMVVKEAPSYVANIGLFYIFERLPTNSTLGYSDYYYPMEDAKAHFFDISPHFSTSKQLLISAMSSGVIGIIIAFVLSRKDRLNTHKFNLFSIFYILAAILSWCAVSTFSSHIDERAVDRNRNNHYLVGTAVYLAKFGAHNFLLAFLIVIVKVALKYT